MTANRRRERLYYGDRRFNNYVPYANGMSRMIVENVRKSPEDVVCGEETYPRNKRPDAFRRRHSGRPTRSIISRPCTHTSLRSSKVPSSATRSRFLPEILRQYTSNSGAKNRPRDDGNALPHGNSHPVYYARSSLAFLKGARGVYIIRDEQ